MTSPQGALSARSRTREASLRKYGHPALIAAYERGDVSLKAADVLVTLRRHEQAALVARGPTICTREVQRMRQTERWVIARERVAAVLVKHTELDLESEADRHRLAAVIASAIGRAP